MFNLNQGYSAGYGNSMLFQLHKSLLSQSFNKNWTIHVVLFFNKIIR